MSNHDHSVPRQSGWTWFEPSSGGPDPEQSSAAQDQALLYARVFRGADGERVLAHLKSLTLERCLGPDSSDQSLRHLEGQRQLIAHILALTERGRRGF